MIEIIPAEESHIPAICLLWLEFLHFSADIDPYFTLREKTSEGFEREYLRPAMGSDKSLVLAAMDGDRIVGYSHAQIEDIPNLLLSRKGTIEHVFVTRDYRRQGIGDRFYTQMLEWFRSRGIERVELQVIEKNDAAESFWRARGFQDFQRTLYREI